jgi:hypothetical protein
VFEGIEYTKTDNLLATSSDGKPRLIRRSANLTLLDAAPGKAEAASGGPATLNKEKTQAAFEAFYESCIELNGNSPELESARLKFLDALK